MSTHRLLHWNAPEQSEFLDVELQVVENAVTVDVQNDEDANGPSGRSVLFEVRDNGDLAVLCYRRGKDEPIVVLLGADGSSKVIDE